MPKEKKSTTDVSTRNSSTKIQKIIEIVVDPSFDGSVIHPRNIGIELDENLILKILFSHYQNVNITKINTINDLEALASRKPDLVFSGVKYFEFRDKDLWLNDYLDTHNIAYIASDRKALDSEGNKSHAKNIMQNSNIATAEYFTTGVGEYTTKESLPIVFPLFIKPLSSGDSMGIDANSFVNDFPSFLAKVAEIHKNQGSRSLVETYLSGKEYSVGIFEDHLTKTLTAMPIEIIADENENGQRILDYDIKKNDLELVIAVTDLQIHEQLSKVAKAAFKALGGKSFGRIDVKMNQDQVPHFIEANLMPGLSKGYFYRSCMLNLNITYEQMILKIAANGLSKN